VNREPGGSRLFFGAHFTASQYGKFVLFRAGQNAILHMVGTVDLTTITPTPLLSSQPFNYVSRNQGND
jgi:hypothetical protein